jgi:hypothetical protein
MVVTCYLDESAVDGSTPDAVVGGLQMNESRRSSFDALWRSLLHDFKLGSALHVIAFGQDGPYGPRSVDERRRIFESAVKLINEHKIYSFAAMLNADQYKSIIDGATGSRFSIYAMCFVAAVCGNRLLAEKNNFTDRIPFLLDAGNAKAGHIRQAHAGLLEMQTSGQQSFSLGSLTFDDDRNVTPLQAADLVCWTVRRRASGKSFLGYEPLEQLLDPSAHITAEIQADVLKGIRNELDTWFAGSASAKAEDSEL